MPKKGEDEVAVVKLTETEYMATGVEEIDELLGGGWARGRLTELWGNPGVGKSHLLARTMAHNKDLKIMYVDAEFALNKARLEELGVDVAKIDFVQDGRLEKVTEHVIGSVGKYDLIIIDSLAKFIPMNVDTSDVGENSIGLFARQVKHFEAKLKPRLAKSKTAMVVINQARAGMGMMQPSKPQGGFAWEHSIDTRVKLSKGQANAITKTVAGVKKQIGHIVTAKVEKSRLTQPFKQTTFEVIY